MEHEAAGDEVRRAARASRRSGLPRVHCRCFDGAAEIGRHRQPDEVAIVRRVPVPVAPAGGRRQHAATDLPVDVERRAAEILVRAQRRVDVGDAIEGVEARRRVAEVRRNLRVLAVRRAQRRRDAGDHLRVALRPLTACSRPDHRIATLSDGANSSCPRTPALSRSLTCCPVLVLKTRAVALRAGERQASGDLAAERAGDRRLRLHEAEIADVQLEVARRA